MEWGLYAGWNHEICSRAAGLNDGDGSVQFKLHYSLVKIYLLATAIFHGRDVLIGAGNGAARTSEYQFGEQIRTIYFPNAGQICVLPDDVGCIRYDRCSILQND